MMKTTIKNSLALALLTGAVAMGGLTACSSDDSIAEETPIVNPTQPKTYSVSIPATMGDGNGTRAVSFEGTTSTSTFTTTEKVNVYNVTQDEVLGGYLSPTNISEDGKSCDLTGSLTGIKPGDEIKLLYNLSKVETDKDIYKYYTYFGYTHQNGTAAGVLDGAIATATVSNSYTSGGALTTTGTASFTNLQSMFRFKFIDENDAPINVKSLKIHSSKTALAMYYFPLVTDAPYSCTVIPVTLTDATTDYIYVALCINESRSNGDVLTFTATDNDGNEYKGTKSAPSGGFKNGKYYWNSSAIQLTKQVPRVKPTITWTSVYEPVEPDGSNCYKVKGPWNDNISNSDPSAITISGTSFGYRFWMTRGATVTLNGLIATYDDNDNNEFIYSDGDLNLVLNGANSISCNNYQLCILVDGTLKLSGNGTLTVTVNSASRYGLYASGNYKPGSNTAPSVLAADGYTVTRSDVTNNQDGTYTWTYTVAEIPPYTKADYREGKWDDSAVTFTKKTATNPTEIANGYSGNIVSGWYTVTGDNVVINSDVWLKGDTHLILCDGAKLTVNKQIFSVSPYYGLYVYGQESGTGELVVSYNVDEPAVYGLAPLEVHGGVVTVENSSNDVISYTPVTVYGGKLTVTATGQSYKGIEAGGDINIYGGELVASSNSNKYAIELSNNATLTVYGGKMSASCPQGKAIDGYVKSGTAGIKFYYADTEGNWDTGTSYSVRQEASNKHYIKAE